MFLTQIFEATSKKIVVIYPGRFQPPHKGHAQVFNHLCQQYGKDNVVICTSDKVDPPRSPFNFVEKKAMWAATGVDPAKVIFDAQPYQAKSYVEKFDSNSTILLFAVSEKDMAEDPRFSFKPKKDGSPSYFQPFKDIAQCLPLAQHGYMITVPTFNFEVLGKPANSATEIRAQFASADEATQKQIVTDLFGKFDPKVYAIMKSKLTSAIAESIKVIASAKNHTAAQLKFTTTNISDINELYAYTKAKAKILFEANIISKSSYYGSSGADGSWRTSFDKRLNPGLRRLTDESVDHQNIKSFIDKIKQFDLSPNSKITVGDSLAVVQFEIVFAHKELELYGFLTPKKITKIDISPDNTIKLITFDDGDTYPRIAPVTYQGATTSYSTFFNDRNSAESAMTMLTLSLPYGWKIIENNLIESLDVGAYTTACSILNESTEQDLENPNPKIRSLAIAVSKMEQELQNLTGQQVESITTEMWTNAREGNINETVECVTKLQSLVEKLPKELADCTVSTVYEALRCADRNRDDLFEIK